MIQHLLYSCYLHRMVGGIAQEIDARSEVLRIERELEEARSRLTAIRRAKYRGEGDSDADGYMSGYDSSMETSGYRTNLNGSDMDRSPAPPPPQLGSFGQAESTPRVRQVYQPQQSPQQQAYPPQPSPQMYQHLQRDQRSVSPVAPPKKQPPATPPRLSSAQKSAQQQQQQQQQQESPLMILQRQRHLLESTTNSVNNSSIEDNIPSFSESRQRFNNSSTFNSSLSSFQSPAQLQHGASGGESSFYTATSTVRNSEQVQHSQVTTTQRTEKISMSSSSKVYQSTQEK